MKNKQRVFKQYENNTQYWNGQSNKFSSPMRNKDIDWSIKNQNWDYMIDIAKRQMNVASYNRENSIHYRSCYFKNNNVNKKRFYQKNFNKTERAA